VQVNYNHCNRSLDYRYGRIRNPHPTGHVIRVKDGDSFLMRSGGLTYEVRMYGIDAPELKQPYGKQSAKTLRSYIHNKKHKSNQIRQRSLWSPDWQNIHRQSIC
jgi:endonuclease YncB( thermonuclease family)